MTDPLTYLDEVDARARRYPEVAQPYLVGLTDELSGYDSDDLVSRAFDAGVAWAEHRDRADLLALSKALRAVLEMHREARVVVSTSIGAPTYSHGCDFCAPLTGETHYPCPTVQEITAALSAPNEGESND